MHCTFDNNVNHRKKHFMLTLSFLLLLKLATLMKHIFSKVEQQNITTKFWKNGIAIVS